MKRIIVIGCPGSGKSTFSRALHKATNLPLIHLDMLYWQADKTIVDKSVFYDRLGKALQGDSWIIDGNYKSSMELRIKACDTIIFLDYDRAICLKGITERQGKPRPDMPWVETELDEEFVEVVKNYNRDCRPQVIDLLEKYREKDIYIFKNRREADEFLSRLLQNAGENADD